jgi:hypothetical protein
MSGRLADASASARRLHASASAESAAAAPSARAPCLLRLQLLPEAARDAVFAALTPREAARACCVSRGWRAALSAPHLWSRLDFVRSAAVPDDAGNVPAVVLGACAKAGHALRAVRLFGETAGVVPAIAAAHPGVESITLVASAWRMPLQPALLAACLGASPALRALYADVRLDVGAPAAHDALLAHPALRATRLTLSAHVSRLADLAAAVRHHARTAEEVTLELDGDAPPAAVREHAAALADALSSCTVLRRVSLSPRVLSAAAFDALAAALQASPCALSHLQVAPGVAEAHLPAVARRLLPRLVSLEVCTEARSGDAAARLDAAQHVLADALRAGAGAALRSLTFNGHAGGAGAVGVLSALAATRLASLSVVTGQAGARDAAEVAALTRSLPACLQSLELTDASNDEHWGPARDALLRALLRLPSLTSLQLQRSDSFDAADCDAVAALLLRGASGASPPALRTLRLCADGGPVHGASRVALALHGAATLTSVSLHGALDDELLLALALALPHSSVQALDTSARLPRALGAPAVRAFAARLRQAASLKTLQLSVSGALEALGPPPAVAPEYRELCRALLELRNAAHPTCAIHVDFDE